MTRRRNAWTALEMLIAVALMALVIAGAYALLHLSSGRGEANLGRRTALSNLRQDARIGIEKLVQRIESGIEILSPEPGHHAAELVFRDLLNRETRIALDGTSGDLASFQRQGEGWRRETESASLVTEGGDPFPSPVLPMRIRDCRAATFRVYSPTLLGLELTLADPGGEGTLVTLVHLRNSQLLEN